MRKWHLPDWLYSALPYLYLCFGLLTMLVLRNKMGVFSGLTLMSAGGIVWMLRNGYCHPFQQSEELYPAPESAVMDENASNRSLSLVKISWRSSYECGHPVIDAQRRQLFGLGNELISAALTKKPKHDVEWLLDELIDHLTNHFCTEEALLAKTRHPLSREHQEIHRSLLAKATNLCGRFRTGHILINEIVDFVAYDMVADHIIKENLKFAVEVRAESIINRNS